MQRKALFNVTNGRFSYGKETIFATLSFQLQHGVFYGLIGPNGSGKSTLIDLLMGTKRLQAGSITFRSKALHLYRRRELARHLALVPQHFVVGFDFSVYDIVMMGRHPHIPRFSSPSAYDLTVVDSVLALLDIEHLKDRPVIHLSGGEKQRVIVARALAQETEVIMLDEATSSRDIEHTLEIMRVLRQKVKTTQTTVVAAIHDLNLASAFCDEFLVLKNGTLRDKGPVGNILTTELLRDVFSVNATILNHRKYPGIEFDMH